MPQPVIDSVNVYYPNGLGYKLPGQPATVTVMAHDLDNHTIEILVKVKNPGGTPVQEQAFIMQQDVMEYEGAAVTPGHSVTPGAQLNEFIVV